MSALWAGRSGVRFPAGVKDFFFSKTPLVGCWAPPSLLFIGCHGYLRGEVVEA